MNFETAHQSSLKGLLHGFDRMFFSGYLMSFFSHTGMYYYLGQQGVLLKDYKTHVIQKTKQLRSHLEQYAKDAEATYVYLNNSRESKEAIAKKALQKQPHKEGLICMIQCLETANSFGVRLDSNNQLSIKKELRQCSHYYLYYQDQDFGWMFIKIQSWFPFNMQAYVNGKEYLKCQLKQNAIVYEEFNNSITDCADLKQAQALADGLINKKWDRFFNALARRINPFIAEFEQIFGQTYNWYVQSCEYATDVLFKQRSTLQALYPALLEKATYFRGGEDVYTFFGRQLQPASKKEVSGNRKKFDQGFRVKHVLDKNSIKMYDKHSVLRIETTINNPKAFKILKKVSKNGQSVLAWKPMGKAVSNLYRYAEVAKKANAKYLDSLSEVAPPGKLNKRLEQISTPTKVKTKSGNHKRIGPFNLLTKQTCLILEAISDARFCIRPFDNKALRDLLIQRRAFPPLKSEKELKQFSNKVTRLIAKLRAHRLIRKISRSFKYELTELGIQVAKHILIMKNPKTNFELSFT
jgi:hypothetical protein